MAHHSASVEYVVVKYVVGEYVVVVEYVVVWKSNASKVGDCHLFIFRYTNLYYFYLCSICRYCIKVDNHVYSQATLGVVAHSHILHI